jgi:acetolactate synthase-1/2/3 large subunit
MMCVSELSTLKTSDSSFVLLIVNNGGYRSIKATQDKFFEGRKLGTDESSGVFIPDYKSLVSCFGIEYRGAKYKNELKSILRDHLTKVDAIKLVVEVFTSEFETIEPLVVSKMNDEGTFENTAIDYMYPYIEFEEFYDFK